MLLTQGDIQQGICMIAETWTAPSAPPNCSALRHWGLWLQCAADYYRDQERWSELTSHRWVGDLELEQGLFWVILSKDSYHCLMAVIVVDLEHSV